MKTLLKAGYNQIGAVFNLDRHDQPGSHWVCLYIGLNPSSPNFGCFFIDSNSTKTPFEIRQLMYRVREQIRHIYKSKKMWDKFTVMENNKQFQFKNTECGMFSIYFMIKFLEKKRFLDIITLDIDDEDVHKFRNIYYIKH